ncbi:MAG: ornithine carbamoyltransferase [Dehalococcoidales bacterium]|nr:ornithine carbamoyltransferase [Dehalococcoidales bacterium]
MTLYLIIVFHAILLESNGGTSLKGKDLLSISDLSREDIRLLVADAVDMKVAGWLSLLSAKTLVLLFEKPSLRTRVSFEIAMRQLGGQSIYLSPAEVGIGQRESVADVARVLCNYVDAITARTFAHRTLEILASYSSVPVINALSDLEHPCQALTDLFTIYEKKGKLEGLKVAYVGDSNNVSNSLMLAALLMGMDFRIASPIGYQVQAEIMHTAQEYAADSGADLFCAEEPQLAVSGADVVYTDVWTSMGQEAETEQRRQIFAGYQVNNELLSLAKKDAIFMHPLPAHHGEEVTEGVLYSPQSVVFDQAENRMHVQKVLLAEILGGLEITSVNYK